MRAGVHVGLLVLGLAVAGVLLRPPGWRERADARMPTATDRASTPSPERPARRLVGVSEEPPSTAAGEPVGPPREDPRIASGLCDPDALGLMLVQGTPTEIRWAEAVLDLLPEEDRAAVQALLDAPPMPEDPTAPVRPLARTLEVRVRLAWLSERFLREELGIDVRGLGADSGPGLTVAPRAGRTYLDGVEVERLEARARRTAMAPAVHDERWLTCDQVRVYTAILDERMTAQDAACGSRPGFVFHVRPTISADERFATLEFSARGATRAGVPVDGEQRRPCTLLRLERSVFMLPVQQPAALLVQPRAVIWSAVPAAGPADPVPMLLLEARTP